MAHVWHLRVSSGGKEVGDALYATERGAVVAGMLQMSQGAGTAAYLRHAHSAFGVDFDDVHENAVFRQREVRLRRDLFGGLPRDFTVTRRSTLPEAAEREVALAAALAGVGRGARNGA